MIHAAPFNDVPTGPESKCLAKDQQKTQPGENCCRCVFTRGVGRRGSSRTCQGIAGAGLRARRGSASADGLVVVAVVVVLLVLVVVVLLLLYVFSI